MYFIKNVLVLINNKTRELTSEDPVKFKVHYNKNEKKCDLRSIDRNFGLLIIILYIILSIALNHTNQIIRSHRTHSN